MPSYHKIPQANICRRLVFVAGIAPPNIRRDVCARMERTKQMKQETHLLFGHIPVRTRLKSRKDFLISVNPSYFTATVERCNEWQRRSRDKSRLGMINLNEESVKGYDSPWHTWRCLNILRTGYTCSQDQRKKWGYLSGDATCTCGQATENTAHMLQGSLFSLITYLHIG